jgi:glycosyltransferase involved in cell wall biosynthesis
MTVEASRFEGASSPVLEKIKYIAYCGDIAGTKDGVSDLIKSFKLLSKRFSDLTMYIIGDAPHSNTLAKLKELSVELGVADKIVFTGRVARDEVPKYLCNATMLALERPPSLQADYGFPSKVGEYLATGNPVVVTNVGEISWFLEDGVSAFIVEPGNPDDFARKMEYVLENPEIAKRVGLKGREVAYSRFDYKVQGKRIIEFLQNI